jgi:hypothetical protein
MLPPRSASAHARSIPGMRGRGAADEDVDAFVQEADEDAVENDDWDTLGGGRMAASHGPPVDIYRRYEAYNTLCCCRMRAANFIRHLTLFYCRSANVAGTDLGAIRGGTSGKPIAAQMRMAPLTACAIFSFNF